MGCREGHIHEKRLSGLPVVVRGEKLQGVVGNGVGVIERFGTVGRIVFRSDVVVAPAERRRIVIAAAAHDGSVKVVESALQRPVVLRAGGRKLVGYMPFAHGVGRIPGRAQNLGYRHAAVVQVSAVPLFAVLFFGHVPDAGLVGMQAGQQACPGGAAPGRVVELGVAQSVCCEAVEIGRTYQTSVAADVGIPHVIGENDQDVGLFPGCCGRRTGRSSEGGQ